MFVGICTLELLLPENRSLKGKRQVLRSVKDRVRNTFNVSIAEVGELDSWQRSIIGVACVGNERAHVDRQITRVLTFVEGLHLAEVAGVHTEIL